MAIIQPPSFSSMLRAQDPFGPGMSTPFQNAQGMRETLGAQTINTGLEARTGLTQENARNKALRDIAKINADSAEEINRDRIRAGALANRQQALLNLATGGGGLASRFAGEVFQPPAPGLGNVANALYGFGNVLAPLDALRTFSSNVSTPTAATQNSLFGVLQAIPRPQSSG